MYMESNNLTIYEAIAGFVIILCLFLLASALERAELALY